MTCKRKGCNNKLPPVAIAHHDPYCSTECCKVDYGLLDPKNITNHGKRAVGSKDVEHGTMHTYTNLRCKCEACRKAASKYYKERDEKRKRRIA